MPDWQSLSSRSPYRTAVAIREQLQQGHVQEAMGGIEELMEAMSRSEERALKSQLVRLMLHIIKWRTQPEYRSLSWVANIKDAREEIADIQEETPSLTDQIIQEMWDKCLRIAKRDAQAEMNRTTPIQDLSWEEVFKADYELDDS